MNLSERDELMARLDERTCNIWALVEKLERHQSEQNGFIKDNLLCTNRNTTWRKVIIGVGSFWLITLTSVLLKVIIG